MGFRQLPSHHNARRRRGGSWCQSSAAADFQSPITLVSMFLVSESALRVLCFVVCPLTGRTMGHRKGKLELEVTVTARLGLSGPASPISGMTQQESQINQHHNVTVLR